MLWKIARSEWPDVITEWNMRGLGWRSWGWCEMAWMLHHRNMRRIMDGDQKQIMRRYLSAVGDHAMLAEWDNRSMADKFTDEQNENQSR